MFGGVLKLSPQKYNEDLSQATIYISGSKLSKNVVQLSQPWKHFPSPYHFLSGVEEKVHAQCSTIDSLCLLGNTKYYIHKSFKTTLREDAPLLIIDPRHVTSQIDINIKPAFFHTFIAFSSGPRRSHSSGETIACSLLFTTPTCFIKLSDFFRTSQTFQFIA